MSFPCAASFRSWNFQAECRALPLDISWATGPSSKQNQRKRHRSPVSVTRPAPLPICGEPEPCAAQFHRCAHCCSGGGGGGARPSSTHPMTPPVIPPMLPPTQGSQRLRAAHIALPFETRPRPTLSGGADPIVRLMRHAGGWRAACLGRRGTGPAGQTGGSESCIAIGALHHRGLHNRDQLQPRPAGGQAARRAGFQGRRVSRRGRARWSVRCRHASAATRIGRTGPGRRQRSPCAGRARRRAVRGGA
jgi:hypothetical protein